MPVIESELVQLAGFLRLKFLHRCSDTYRAVYAVALGESIYILHAFQKKSTSGINTPKSDLELIGKRLKAAKERENP